MKKFLKQITMAGLLAAILAICYVAVSCLFPSASQAQMVIPQDAAERLAAVETVIDYVEAATGGYDVASTWVPAHSAAVAYVEAATGGYDVASTWVPAHSAAVAYVEAATGGYDVASTWVPAHSAAVAYVEAATGGYDTASAAIALGITTNIQVLVPGSVTNTLVFTDGVLTSKTVP